MLPATPLSPNRPGKKYISTNKNIFQPSADSTNRFNEAYQMGSISRSGYNMSQSSFQAYQDVRPGKEYQMYIQKTSARAEIDQLRKKQKPKPKFVDMKTHKFYNKK